MHRLRVIVRAMWWQPQRVRWCSGAAEGGRLQGFLVTISMPPVVLHRRWPISEIHISFVWQLTSNDQETTEEAGASVGSKLSPDPFLCCFSAAPASALAQMPTYVVGLLRRRAVQRGSPRRRSMLPTLSQAGPWAG